MTDSRGLTDKERFEAYFYPGTTTLRNLYDERDPKRLQQIESDKSHVMSMALRLAPLSGEFDIQHMQAIHRALFGEIYPWAGQLRDFPLFKRRVDGMSNSEFARPEEFAQVERSLLEVLTRNDKFKQLDPKSAVADLAHVYQLANHLHPFREGNGRTHRIFLEYLANRANLSLDFAKVHKEAWKYAAGEAAVLNIGGDRVPGTRAPLTRVFEHIVTNRDGSPIGAYARGRYGLRAPTAAANRTLMLADLNPALKPRAMSYRAR